MIQNALHSPALGEYFTYPERIRTTLRKFLLASEVKFFAKSDTTKQNIPKVGRSASEDWFSKKSLESHFSLNKKCFVGRTVRIESALQIPDLVECFTYPERIRMTYKTSFLWASEVKIFTKHYTVWQYILKPDRISEGWFSKNPLQSHFFFNKKFYVAHTVIIQSAF